MLFNILVAKLEMNSVSKGLLRQIGQVTGTLKKKFKILNNENMSTIG